MKLSVVTTLYRSDQTVQEFHRRVALAASEIAAAVEFVYVNDGSPDRSMERVLHLRSEDPRIVVVDLARNFGHHPALMTGLAVASGDFVFLIDSDLEEPPELLLEFWQASRANPGADAVYGVQMRRKGGLWERAAGAIWYTLFCRLTRVAYPPDSLTARLMTRRFVDAALLHKERDLDLMGIFALVGYEQIALPTTKGSKGESAYTLGKRLRIAVTGLTAFTTAPLALIPAAGCLMILLSLAGGVIWLLSSWVSRGGFSPASFAVWSIWFVGGLLLSAVGVLALYARAILQETKARPRAIIRRIYGSEQS
ncbi:MAG: glycosyltransferase family 2 protein [Pseudomonadota bacterium]|nr:glycosyltransferase family 2 protein [Pseudomonadota bacterium]